MADAYVTRDQFDEFVKRIEQAFGYAEKARSQELALVNQRFELVEKRFEQVEKRFEQVDQRFEQVEKRFEQVDQRFDQIDQRFEQIDRRFERVERRLDDLRTEVRTEIQSVRNWMIGLFSPLVLALVTAVIKWVFFSPTP